MHQPAYGGTSEEKEKNRRQLFVLISFAIDSKVKWPYQNEIVFISSDMLKTVHFSIGFDEQAGKCLFCVIFSLLSCLFLSFPGFFLAFSSNFLPVPNSFGPGRKACFMNIFFHHFCESTKSMYFRASSKTTNKHSQRTDFSSKKRSNVIEKYYVRLIGHSSLISPFSFIASSFRTRPRSKNIDRSFASYQSGYLSSPQCSFGQNFARKLLASSCMFCLFHIVIRFM